MTLNPINEKENPFAVDFGVTWHTECNKFFPPKRKTLARHGRTICWRTYINTFWLSRTDRCLLTTHMYCQFGRQQMFIRQQKQNSCRNVCVHPFIPYRQFDNGNSNSNNTNSRKPQKMLLNQFDSILITHRHTFHWKCKQFHKVK